MDWRTPPTLRPLERIGALGKSADRHVEPPKLCDERVNGYHVRFFDATANTLWYFDFEMRLNRLSEVILDCPAKSDTWEISNVRQCKHCPWKKSTNPDTDIPNGYCRKMHKDLHRTIAKPGELNLNPRLMACHESPIGRERICVGWAHNQLTIGNNIGLRWRALSDPRFKDLQIVGPQHWRFEDTLPTTNVVQED